MADALIDAITGSVAGIASRATLSLISSARIWSSRPSADGASVEPGHLSSYGNLVHHLENCEEAHLQELERFVGSPEFSLVVRQVTELSGVETPDPVAIASIRNEYRSLAKIRVPSADPATLTALFEMAYQATQYSLDAVPQPFRPDASRFNGDPSRAEAVATNVGKFASQTATQLASILDFEAEYRSQVANRHSHIRPPSIESATRIPIDDIYVPSQLLSSDNQPHTRDSTISVDELLKSLPDRSVVLGNPGGGKSTLATKVCHELAANYHNRIAADRYLTPVYVELREYSVAKSERATSILDFIEQICNSRYQLNPPSGAFEYMLRTGRLLAVFDGLDELLDTSSRQEISQDVESFANLYPWVPIVVTSRSVGYEQAPLDSSTFTPFVLSPFGRSEVSEYVHKWFRIAAQDDPELDVDRIANSFLRESEHVSDLRSSPLLLSLMCNIYGGEGYIPINRPHIYDKCATMLLERWDRARGIHYALPFAEHIGSVVQDLAHWMYDSPAAQSGVTRQALIEHVTEFLVPRRYESHELASSAAEQFVTFCTERAWVFTDIGTTGSGERLYGFTHRTFLEYFTARYLVWAFGTPPELLKRLRRKVGRGEWEAVGHLAVQMLHMRVDGAGDSILDGLRRTAIAPSTSQARRNNLLTFVGRALSFMVPSPSVARSITRSCASYYGTNPRPHRVRAKQKRFAALEVLVAPMDANGENLSLVQDEVKLEIQEWIDSGDPSLVHNALEVATNISVIPYLSSSAALTNANNASEWEQLGEDIRAANGVVFREWAQYYPALAYDLLLDNRVSLEEFVRWHGMDAMFKVFEYVNLPFRCGALIERVVDLRMVSASQDGALTLANIGKFMSSVPFPWPIRASHGRWFSPTTQMDLLRHDQPTNAFAFRSNELFAVFVVIATAIESGDDELQLRFLQELPDASGALELMRLLTSSSGRKLVSAEGLPTLGVSHVHADAIRQWCVGELSVWSQ